MNIEREERTLPPREAYHALLERAVSVARSDQRRTNEEIVAAILADLSESDTRRAAEGMMEDATAAAEGLALMGLEDDSERLEAKAAPQELKAGDEETWQLALAVLKKTLTATVAAEREAALE